jgi:hypothetical protein
MQNTDIEESTVIRYLLDDLPEPEADRLEESYFVNTDVFERINEIEERLIRSYLDGAINEPDAERFERKYYRIPALREKVAFARALRALPARTRQEPVSTTGWLQRLAGNGMAVFRLSIGFAVLGVILLALAFVVAQTPRTGVEPNSGRAVPERASNPSPVRTASPVVLAMLHPGESKGSGAEAWVTVPREMQSVPLQFELPGVTSVFEAHVEVFRLRDAGRGLVAAQSALPVSLDVSKAGASVIAIFTAAELSSGDYLAYVKRDDNDEVLQSYRFGVNNSSAPVR